MMNGYYTQMVTYICLKQLIQHFPTDIKAGRRNVVLASPESLKKTEWQTMLRTETYQQQLVAVVFDEAHCISDW